MAEAAHQARDAESANEALMAPVLVLSLLQFGLLPLLFGMSTTGNTLLLIAIVLLTPLHWGLAHESFHGGLSRDAARNRVCGRLLGWFLCMSWDLIRFGHLMHHDSNRHLLDRPEVLEPGQTRVGGGIAYFAKLLGGHAVISVLSGLGVLVPEAVTKRVIERVGGDPELAKIRAAALRAFTNAERRTRIRGDLVMIALLVAGAIWAWGAAWPVFAASLGLRWMTLSLLDNAPHYGTSIDSGRAARNTRIPAALRWLIMNHNFHGVHHRLPDLNWRELPPEFDRLGGAYAGSWFVQVLRQFRGPLRADELKPVAAEPLTP